MLWQVYRPSQTPHLTLPPEWGQTSQETYQESIMAGNEKRHSRNQTWGYFNQVTQDASKDNKTSLRTHIYFQTNKLLKRPQKNPKVVIRNKKKISNSHAQVLKPSLGVIVKTVKEWICSILHPYELIIILVKLTSNWRWRIGFCSAFGDTKSKNHMQR